MITESPTPLRKPDSLRSQVENYLREAIMNGRFKPGEKLSERELCELLDVSRPSLREALRKLEAEKLITMVLHRGPMVSSISLAEARDLYAIRALFESYAVSGFAKLASDEAVARLGDVVQTLKDEAASGDRKRLLAAKADFYDVILNGCGNALIKEMLLSLLSRINLLRATSFSSPDRLPESLKEIDQLYAHIKARNADAAGKAAVLHIQNAEKAALDVLSQEQPLALPTPS
ncbi:GntR family transcriptional regulator [Herbaspirillum sp. RTI4]|uniref:GntR family transcriptional regulator n=1 Tax=Herbaspirillum sp. RTI4 TaxID=3048640 RepID=UPI002AB32BEE|nr:GntR family transcriptional regulator [Herbaspirillum sp. RTI4]MDY7577700.1 GntR family transcriptional regulator [Herbaspirillum sp. RTI4]MEA9980872.1 GntR family transcriptional regulator [Herbaspirillum sp. RTI4]